MVVKIGNGAWLILLCLANLSTTSGNFWFELTEVKLDLLNGQMKQITEMRNNSEATLRQLENKIAELEDDHRKKTDAMQRSHENLETQILQLTSLVQKLAEAVDRYQNALERKSENMMTQLTELVNKNSEAVTQQVETRIAQLTEDMRRMSETTNQQLEAKTSLLTNTAEKNHVSVLSQIAQQQQKMVQLTELIETNSKTSQKQVETTTSLLTNAVEKNHLKISQLTELMETKSEATKKQIEMKTSLVTNAVERNHVSVLGQIAQQQQKATQLAEQIRTNFNATKTVEIRLVNLKETISHNEKLLNVIKNSTSDLVNYIPNPCKTQKTNILCVSNSHGENWIVVQQRIDLESTSFNRTWSEYREGFGTIGESSSFWWGLERLYQLTNNNNYELLVEVTNKYGAIRFVRYSQFKIGSEAEKYKLLELSGFSGTERDANSFYSGEVPTGQMFSTFDSDNDQWTRRNCASSRGGGWWWSACGYSINESGSRAKDASWSYFWSMGSMKSTRMSIRERK